MLDDFFKSISDSINDLVNYTHENYIKIISDYFDKKINKIEIKKNLKSQGGYCNISYKVDNDKEYICATAEIYLQDKDKNWKKVNIDGGTIQISQFNQNDKATKDFIEKVKKENIKIPFEKD